MPAALVRFLDTLGICDPADLPWKPTNPGDECPF